MYIIYFRFYVFVHLIRPTYSIFCPLVGQRGSVPNRDFDQRGNETENITQTVKNVVNFTDSCFSNFVYVSRSAKCSFRDFNPLKGFPYIKSVFVSLLQGPDILFTSCRLVHSGELSCSCLTKAGFQRWNKRSVVFLFDHLLIICRKVM